MKINITLPSSVTSLMHKKVFPNTIRNNPLHKDCFGAFKPIFYDKCSSLAEINVFKAMNFPNTELKVSKVSDGNRILRTMCHLHNMTKGRIAFPPVIETYIAKNPKYDGDYGAGVVRLLSNSRQMESTLAHEFAHYNHERCCQDYLKMGKESELKADSVTDFSIFEYFRHDKPSLKIIKRYLGGYATSSACEFVACTFENLANGRLLPLELWELYNKYQGPFAKILKPLFV